MRLVLQAAPAVLKQQKHLKTVWNGDSGAPGALQTWFGAFFWHLRVQQQILTALLFTALEGVMSLNPYRYSQAGVSRISVNAPFLLGFRIVAFAYSDHSYKDPHRNSKQRTVRRASNTRSRNAEKIYACKGRQR